MVSQTKYRIHRDGQGFTLIELSVVLVIIGLLVGGVLVGRDLIAASALRAQISQIEKYQQAINTFRGKYGYLPGDIPDPDASRFGFIARGQFRGQGDGNGMIEGNGCSGRDCSSSLDIESGETATFWIDLGKVGLIDNQLSLSGPARDDITVTSGFHVYTPVARINQGNYIYVWNGGYLTGYGGGSGQPGDSSNYFGLSAITVMSSGWPLSSNAGLTVQQAFALDKKLDDGLPQSGNVVAFFDGWGGSRWAAGNGALGASSGSNSPTTARTPASVNTCYDNNNIAGAVQQYSVTQNNGTGLNCALSSSFSELGFRMAQGVRRWVHLPPASACSAATLSRQYSALSREQGRPSSSRVPT